MTGLCSVTFRHLDVDQIIDFAVNAKLKIIEWGADLHVPSGNYEIAKEVCAKMKAAGLKTSSYGSYYKLGEEDEYYAMFSSLVETAIRLEAPRIRIWAGSMASSKISPFHQQEMIDELIEICSMAQKENLEVALEFHRNSLNDNAQTCLEVLQKANCPNLSTYWQITPNLEHNLRVKELSDIKDSLSAVHVFYWAENNIRFALNDGNDIWCDYHNVIQDLDIDYLIEFVKDDSVEQGLKDAKYLRKLVRKDI